MEVLKKNKMVEITKINDVTWKIEKQGNMLVPVMLFVSEPLLEKIKKDSTLQQAQNMASVPGVIKNVIVCPDAHQGYGACIGGVSAYDFEKGVVSPGQVGYDINCLPGNAKVSLQYGTWLQIRDIEKKWNTFQLSFSDLKTKNVNTSNLTAFMKRPNSGVLFEIKTKTGHTLRVTDEHPILTPSGMKKAEELTKEDKVLIHAFKGIEYEEPSDEIILTEEDLVPLLDHFGIGVNGNARKQVLREIQKLDILPLRYNSKKLPILLKYLGYLFGDGNIHFSSYGGNIHCWGRKEDLLTIQDDLRSIGINGVNIHQRERDHKIKTKYGLQEFSVTEYSLQKHATSLFILLVALGCPHGKKAIQEYRVSQWIMKAPLWQKRLFLASFFGAELSFSKTNNGYNFTEYALGMNKLVTLEQNAKDFLQDIRKLLSDFEVTSSEPVHVEGQTYDGKDGQSTGWRILVQTNPENHLRFLETVNFEYHKEKQKKAHLVAHYLRFKENIIHIRMRVREREKQMKNEMFPKQTILASLCEEYVNERFIERSMYETRENEGVAFSSLSFEEYCQKYAVGESGFAWTDIERIRLVPYEGMVYDVTMDNENHNFIAENFVVSNCGVRLLATNLKKEDIEQKKKELIDELFRVIPSGVGKGTVLKITQEDLKLILKEGAEWAVKKGFGNKHDLEKTEDGGKISYADPSAVSERALQRGFSQLGSLGSGNHFLEIQYVSKIYNPEIAKTFGLLEEGQAVVMFHCGSRGLGHQVASDYIRKMEDTFGWKHLPDRELVNAPISSDLGKKYLDAMAAAANFAFCNRQMIMEWTRQTFVKVFGAHVKLEVVYDVTHNMAKIEEYDIDGKKRKLCVHRKGATRAFGPGRKELPKEYRDVGQPILIPGSMGTSSYVLVGTKKAEELTFSSTAHGAGRLMSRHTAIRTWSSEDVKKDLAHKEIYIKAGSWSGISEEAPGAYKNVDEVVAVSDAAGIGKIVCQLKPMGVVKG